MSDRVEELLAHAVAALGGAERTGQVTMARAVHGAMESGRHLAVQAGTGTGKSLAYLVPAIVRAMEDDQAVIVSTATIALQRQLVERDLPRLADALEPHLDRRPTFSILKGRNNYLCRNKVAEVPLDPDDGIGDTGALIDSSTLSKTAAQVLMLREWANDTEDGDRDSLDRGVSDMAWRQVSVTSRECVGAAKCPMGDTCFAEAAKARAADVDVVVTNHALLAIDALSDGLILPQHECVVVDEAHELDARITSVATDELTSTGVTLTAKRAKNAGAVEEAGDLEDAAGMLQEALVSLGDDGVGRWEEIPPDVGVPLTALRDALWRAQTALATSQEGDATERQTVRAALENMHDAAVRILALDDADVVWLTDRRALCVAPLTVSDLLRDRLFGENTVVLTSATLALGGKFDAMAAAWGLPRGKWDGMDVGTPFEPAKSGILYVARHLPKPGRDGTDPKVMDELAALITAAGGRTLGLFSSRRGAEAAAEEMRRRLPFEVLCQGDDAIGNLVEQFTVNENSCLFGTLSLWQGVDVPGPSLSLVVIDRIPFPRPDDPLLSARSDAANRAGRSGFMEVSATHAALLMAQGAGRLLRSVDDRGVVAVLDPRLATQRYGSWIAASMPPFWRTTDGAVARSALERLVAQRYGG
ncbi:ATP-dependent DNA helicase [Corynebacterium freneyi]|uniref:ATP-dependent helicase DinG n=1 Tax=Corynebacterium freneyi DNF00450 TaxID=1287475 RepID=A0A095Y8K1_9CORY|nr:ATP-dependent DNA helicase [Corynebacterium freneyi]KGF18371.1 ATP-dependent helicase [Corynebacterium freneyi DNF00450]